ncbi:MAG: hypothetical protein JKY19_07660 [Alcanivoracaceae bacterium]|nr:hypothetical protein [Alcanivoracaceae bacterium]
MLKRILMTSLLTTGFYAQADNDISYSYFEVGYDYIDLSGAHADGVYLNGSFDLNKSLYMGGYFDRDDINGIDFDQYGLFPGFHNSISKRTDFYSELNIGRLDVRSFDSTTYGLDIGTRTAFSEKFELITKLGYLHNDKLSDGFIKVGVKGLFKFNEHNAVTFGVENFDGDDFGASVGYRFSF